MVKQRITKSTHILHSNHLEEREKFFFFFVVPITFFLPIITLLFVFSRQRLMPASSRSSIEMNQ